MFHRHPSSLLVIALLSLSVTGCTMPTALPDTSTPLFEGLSFTPPPSPLPETEVKPDSPRTQVWRPGYWSDENGEFRWVAGTVIDRPSPTAVWSSDRWMRRDYGWVFVGGYWQ